ncbi:MAG: HD-GYP domain-containing protein [Treponemataceae bacterium]|nr:HD-GYP domain-containing protein [Treponemataceae bacterium]
MNKINSDLLELGMKFSAPVFFDDGKYMFLAEKKPIRKFHLETLQRWNIPYVVTYGHLLPKASIDLDELLGAPEEIEELETEETTSSGAYAVPRENDSELTDEYVGRIDENPLFISYCELISAMGMIIESIRAGAASDIVSYIESLSNQLYSLIEKNATFVTGFLLMGEAKKHDFAQAAVDSAILTYLISKKLGISPKKIKLYVTGALVHDIGMFILPESLISKKTSLLSEEFSKLKMHTIEGAHMAGSLLHCPAEVTDMITQHHEHWDGNGYPRGLKGDEISTGAAILAVTDAFEAMVTEKAYRTSMLGYEAMRVLISDNCHHFSPEVVRAFIQCMGVYPIGSLVLLSDASIGRVVQGNDSSPLRPDIRILMSETGKKYPNNTGPVVKLEGMRKLFIVRALDAKDLHGKLE